ncbi:MAG: carbohydrate ABC transporter permease [Clostridia bacterium]|nr:carbohydrate ABC transporter permease [Clostridia bacterium]
MHRKIHSREDIIVDSLACLIGLIFLLLTGIPFLHVLSKAFSSETALIANRVTIIPSGFQTGTIRHVLTSPMFIHSFLHSVLVTVSGTLLSVIVTAMAGYALSKRNLPWMKTITVIFVFTMWFNGGMVPRYLLMSQLQLTNTFWALILPAAISVYNLLLVKNYCETIPSSLEESAWIDGAGQARTLFTIVIPLSYPVLATITLFMAVSLWNDYYNPMIYITRSSMKTLQVYLRDIIVESQSDTTMISADDINLLPEGVRAASIIASTVPILLIYPFLQKYLIKGIMIGAVKG